MCLEQWAVCSWCEAKAEGAKQGGGARRALTAFGRTTLPELGVLHLWKDADIPSGRSKKAVLPCPRAPLYRLRENSW